MHHKATRLLLGLLSVTAVTFFSGCGVFDSTSGPRKITVTRGNSLGAVWKATGHNAEIHLKLLNEADVRADWLELEFSFQFGSDNSSITAYVRDQSGGGIYYPLKPGSEADYDFNINDSDPKFDGRAFADLTLVRLATIYFYNYQEDATRATDTISYSMTLWQN